MGRTSLVSVVITNYNYGRYIKQAIESVLSQTYPNIELIIINDGSTDNSMSVINKYDKTAKIINHENKDIVFVRNEALELASGDFICFLDADDYFDDDYIEKSMEIARKHNADVVFPNWRVFGDAEYKTDFNEFDLQLLICHRIHCTAESLIRRSAIKGHKFESEIIAEDWDFFLGMALAGKKFKLAKNNFINYRAKNDSRARSRGLEEKLYAYCGILQKWSEKYPDKINIIDLPISYAVMNRDALDELKKEHTQAKEDINNILNSKGYKAGNIIAAPFRLLGKLLSRNRN